jgi:hypothetical protein
MDPYTTYENNYPPYNKETNYIMVYPTLTSCGITWLQKITHKLLTLTKVNNCMLDSTKSSTCPCASLMFSTSSTCPCGSLVLSTTKAKYRCVACCAVLRGFLRGSPSLSYRVSLCSNRLIKDHRWCWFYLRVLECRCWMDGVPQV